MNVEKITFLVQGSKKEPYEVLFAKTSSGPVAGCTCPAGQSGTHCKHRIRILMGSTEDIVSKNINEVATVVKWFSGSLLEQKLISLEQKEIQALNLETELKLLKKEVAKLMMKAS